MQLELLDYHYTTDWNLDQFVNNIPFKDKILPHFPLVNSTWSAARPEVVEKLWQEFSSGRRRGRPTEILDSIFQNTTAKISNPLHSNREVFNINATCSSALYAFYMAALVSQDLQTPVVVFCGDNKSTPYDLWHFSSLGAMDNTTGRPFDSTSQGLRMGTCCVAFLVKHPSVKFNYPVQAVIDNFYFYTNSSLMVHPGTADELLTNLGNIQYKSTDLWNAHATGTPIGDRVEYEFFSNAVKHDVPIVGFKGYVGHCMSAAGAIEIAMALDCKKNNRLLPNIIQGEPIANDSRIIVLPTSFDYKRMIKPSLGFGGKTAVVEVTFE